MVNDYSVRVNHRVSIRVRVRIRNRARIKKWVSLSSGLKSFSLLFFFGLNNAPTLRKCFDHSPKPFGFRKSCISPK